jgi:hypothetical protein
MKRFFLAVGLIAVAFSSASAQRVATVASPKINRPMTPDGFAPVMTPSGRANFDAALMKKTLNTAPTWTNSFTINGKTYKYTLVGSAPATGTKTQVPVVIVPVKLTVSDYLVNGSPLVLNASDIASHVIASPIFTPVLYGSQQRQFIDGMLHSEFPAAANAWGTVFTPTIGPELSLVSPAGAVKVKKIKAAGSPARYLATISKAGFLDNAISAATNAAAAPGTIYIFVTYNSLENAAFGYHTFNNATVGGKNSALIYIYTSWLEGVDSAFSVPSPDAATLAHEIAEVEHDPLLTSKTLKWGDAFSNNKCFMSLIEVGDAVEFAPADVQLYSQAGFTVQVEANLGWFTRDTTPGTVYSFPSSTAFNAPTSFSAPPAPLTCTP